MSIYLPIYVNSHRYEAREIIESMQFDKEVKIATVLEIIIATEDEPIKPIKPDKEACPNPMCTAFVRSGSERCLICDTIIVRCRKCGASISKDIGICDMCSYNIEGIAIERGLSSPGRYRKKLPVSSEADDEKIKGPKDRHGQKITGPNPNITN